LFLGTCADDRSLEDIVNYAYEHNLTRSRKALKAFVSVLEGKCQTRNQRISEAKIGLVLRKFAQIIRLYDPCPGRAYQ
jgi:hypothetical protein